MTDEPEVVELKLDEQNELLFKVKIVGADSPPQAFRLVCEDKGISYAFNGTLVEDEDGTVKFTLPAMENKVSAGRVYDCAIEVLVENRYFRPVTFGVKFKETVRCVVESVTPKKEKLFSVVAERKDVSKPVVTKVSEPVTFFIKPVKPSSVPESHKQTLREKHESRKKGTGIDEKIMEEVAQSTLEKLSRISARDSESKRNK